MRLTQNLVAKLALPKGKSDAIFFDDEIAGFGLRIRAGGSRKWVVHFRRAGEQRRHTIGAASTLTLEEARKRARKVLVAVDEGKDPTAERAHKRAASALTFSAVAEDYLAVRQRDMKPRSLVECARHIQKHWKPLHGLALGAVTRSIVATHMRKIAEHNGPFAANRARANLSAMFAWAIGEGLCESNPVVGTNKATEEVTRDRVLTDDELAAIWKAAPNNSYGRIVRLLMLTGQRREEIGALRWPELQFLDDAKRGLIALPAVRTKNSRPHDVPLSAAALAVLNAQPRIAGRDLVFGEGEGGYSGWSVSKAALDEASGIKDWRVHDLRRTAATRMADLGVQPHVIEAVLNHVSGHKAGVAGVYNRSSYSAEKRAAMEIWSNHVQVVLAGGNVVKLKRAE